MLVGSQSERVSKAKRYKASYTLEHGTERQTEQLTEHQTER